jgi:protein phosphatase
LDGDRLLLCTDGLTDMLKDSDITEIFNENADSQSFCDRLIARALDAGGKDNVTVVLAHYSIPARH